MDVAILRFDAPLMSFGGVMVDQHGFISRFPGQSFLAGLFGNALGYSHGDWELLDRLQDRIEYAARWDFPPEKLVDYHTVDLGQEKMKDGGWTTRGEPEHRSGGSAKYGTHQRYRHYWANGLMTVAATLSGSGEPSIATVGSALNEPKRPLFLGRKTCIPASPILIETISESSVLEALRNVPAAKRDGNSPAEKMEACWPVKLGMNVGSGRVVRVYDLRNWKNQLHAGPRERIEGLLEVRVS